MKLGSLFDGSGGFPLAGAINGIEPVWASEVEPFPLAVTKHRFPEMKHLGDVSKINGAEIEPVDIITGGSPCFPAGTLVLTDKSYIPIEDVEVGMKVLTHKGRWREVTAVGNHMASTILLNGNSCLECTPNHPIYSHNGDFKTGWVCAEKMFGNYWGTPRFINCTETTTINDADSCIKFILGNEYIPSYVYSMNDKKRTDILLGILDKMGKVRCRESCENDCLTMFTKSRILAFGFRTLAETLNFETQVIGSNGYEVVISHKRRNVTPRQSWYEVKKIERESYCNKRVFNLTVDEDNSYVADSIVVHNCQDLSHAGKRAGLQEGKRSHLFYEFMRIVKEMRGATDGRFPRFIIFENVPGAFSSAKGEDFRCVLEEVCKIKDENVLIPKPKGGKWTNAGSIVGEGYSVAWRVLDAEYWGVPQRRNRIYLIADFNGECASQILFESCGLSGDTTESEEQGQGTPETFGGDIEAAMPGWVHR